jgi:hypothetical protein
MCFIDFGSWLAGMTHDILQSDIDLATELVRAKRTDQEIVNALAQRRIDPVKAAQLVADLRQGKTVVPERVNFSWPTPAQASDATEAAPAERQSPATHAAGQTSRHHANARSPAGRPKPFTSVWLFTLVCITAVAVGLAIAYYFYHSRTDTGAEPREGASPVIKSNEPPALPQALRGDKTN